MATIKIDQFHGISPRTHPTLLADGMAVTAHNCRLKNGKLVPLRMPSKADDATLLMENGLANVEDSQSILPWKRTDGGVDFLLFPGIVWMAEGNVADDERTRIVVSGETGVAFGDVANAPQVYMRNPVTGRKFVHPLCKVALPAPKVSRVSTSALGENRRYTYFFMTWVDEYGYESPVSPQSQVYDSAQGKWVDGDLEYLDGDTVKIEALGADAIPTGAVSLRVYKVVTGTETGRIQFVKETPALGMATNPLNVTVKDEDAGEVLMEIESPFHDLRCILDVPGSFYCGFSPSHPKTVCFSEVDLLYSWPIAYQYDIKDNIVALAVTSNTVFALTDGWPYVLNGTSPEGMTVTKLAGPAACVSARGVCVYRNAVYYAGHQGLMTIYNDANAGTVCANLTDKIFTKDQWQAFNPSSCVMGQHDGALHLFFALSDGTHRGLSIDLNESMSAVTTHDEVAKCVCVDNKTDRMYYVREGV